MSELIFVTGASGFLGSHIVDQLLEKGYRVRAAARGHKVAELKESYASFGDRFEAVDIPDISTGQFPDALLGVNAIIHAAAPLPGRAESELILKGAVDGTLNVVRQAQRAGITRVIVTSSIVTAVNPNNSLTDKDWRPVDKDKAAEGSELEVYAVAKTIAEQELWAFGDAHPELDITTFNPPLLYGPFAQGYTQPAPNYAALSTNIFIYRLLKPSSTFPPSAAHADVRDVAAAHVRALNSPPASAVGRKRILLASPHALVLKDVIGLVEKQRPELKDRLNRATPPAYPFDRVPIDFARVEEVLGLKKGDFRTVEETVLDTADSLLVLEKQWVDAGYEVAIPDE